MKKIFTSPDGDKPKNSSDRIYGTHPWSNFIPSKKIIIVIACLLVIGLLYAGRNIISNTFQYLTGKTPLSISQIPQPEIVQEKESLSIDEDTDGDGLMDWQETLLGTNPYEVNAKEDVSESVRDLINTPNTIQTSDKLALAIYERARTIPVGENIEEQVSAAATKEILDYANSLDQQLTTYTIADIQLGDETPEVRTVYSQKILGLLNQLQPSEETTSQVYEKFLKNSSGTINPLYETNLVTGIKKMLEMEVPFKLTDTHLTLLNAITHSYEIVRNQTLSPSDDETANFAAMLVFQKNVNLAQDSMLSLIAQLSN